MACPKSFVSLPVEVIMVILQSLSLCDLVNIRLQTKFLRDIADKMIHKLYREEIHFAALLDTFPSLDNNPILERLAKLRRHENAWTYFKPNAHGKHEHVPEITIRSIQDKKRLGNRHINQHMCDLNGDYFLMGVPGIGSAEAVTAVYYCRIPSGDQFLSAAGPPDLRANADTPKLTFRTWPSPPIEDMDDELDRNGIGYFMGTDPNTADVEDSEFSDDTGSNSASDSEGSADSSAHSADSAQTEPGSNRSLESVFSIHADEDALMDFVDWDAGSADPSDINKPSQPAKMIKPYWICIPFAIHPQEVILGFKLAVEESNLLVVITSASSRNASSLIYLYLFYFPSGHAHPSAALSHIDLGVNEACFDNCCIRLLDGKLGVLLSTSQPLTDDRDGNSVDRFFLFDWRSGNLLMIKTAGDWETYHRFSFLSNDTIIFPNTSEWCIELCNIITDPPGSSCTHDQDCPGILIPTLILALPELRDTTTLWGFGCDTQQPSASTKDSSSFQSPLANGLVVFSFSMDYRDADGTGNISDIRFVIHKQALFELLSSSSTAEATNEEPLCLPWPQWGPSRTRWFDAHEPADFSPTTWGQRIVIIRPKYSHSDCRPIYVYNFNPVTVSTTTSTASTTVMTSLDPFNLNEDWDSTDSQAAFQETIWSQLPCIISESPFDFGCISGAVMDRDRIILLRSASGLLTGIAWLIVLHMA